VINLGQINYRGKNIECKRCFNIEYFDPLTKRDIKIYNDGLCSLCKQDIKCKPGFLSLKRQVQDELPKLFEKIKREKHEYDAIVWLSGGKDSSAALILAKEKYKLNILAFTIDRGNQFKQTKENIDNLTNKLGIDHVNFKTPNKIFKDLFKFGISTMSTFGICCKVCGSLMHRPITSKILLKYDFGSVITGVDIWEIYGAYLDQKWREDKNKIKQNFNQFYQYLPQFNHLVHDYDFFINDILSQLRIFSKDDAHYENLKNEFLQIIEPIKRWWLNKTEIQKFNEINEKIKYIPLPAVEISTKKELMKLLKQYTWKIPKLLPSGQIIGTDCQVANLVNGITSDIAKIKFSSYKVISGSETKQEMLDEINKPINIQILKKIMKNFGIKKLENRLKHGWQNPKYKELYNLDIINELNQ